MPDRPVELDPPLLDQDHDRRGGEGLGRRADLEQRRLVDGPAMIDTSDAVRDDLALPAQINAHRDAGNAQFPGRLRHLIVEYDRLISHTEDSTRESTLDFSLHFFARR